MSAKKRALGRGLDTLIGAPLEESQISEDRRVTNIPVQAIRPNVNQPRTQFNEEQIAELADSIREKGILQPLLVRYRPDGYELVAGERRWRAAQSLSLETVPCLVLEEVSDEAALEIALIENLQREDLNAIEEARAFKSLMDQFHFNQEEIAARVGKKRPTIANSLRLLNLPLDIQEDIQENRLTPGHARAILSLSEAPKQRQLRNLIVARGLSVREAESTARRLAQGRKVQPPKPVEVQAQMRSLQEELSMKIGLPVFIKPFSNQAGKVEIQYHSLDDFEILTDFFGIEKT